MQKQQGFTLIELIVVIIILGILAVTAAPKFIDVQEDAQTAAMTGIAGGIRSAADLVYAKAAIDGQLTSNQDVTTSGGTVKALHGYPTAALDGILAAVDIANIQPEQSTVADNADFEYVYEVANNSLTIVPGRLATAADLTSLTCKVTYAQATSATSGANVTTVLTGCK